MKQHLLLFVTALAAAAAAAAGCGEPSNLRPMQEETQGIVKSYAERVAALDRRAQEIIRRAGALQLGPDATLPSAQLDDVMRGLLPAMQGVLRDAPARIARTVEDGQLDERARLDALRIASYQIESRLANDWLRANAKLDSVEAWLSRAERRAPAPRDAPTR